MTSKSLIILNGPGSFSAGGNVSAEEVQALCAQACEQQGLDMEFRIAASLNELLDWAQQAGDTHSAIIVNPTGKMAADDDQEKLEAALSAGNNSGKPIVDVRISNIFVDGDQHPLKVATGKTGFICGLGAEGYRLAIKSIASKLEMSAAVTS